MMKNYFYILLSTVCFCTSCYDDLGNYDYNAINEIKIEMETEYHIQVPSEGTNSIIISPKVTQMLNADTSCLEYRWRVANEESKFQIMQQGKDLKVTVTSKDLTDLRLRFEVIDTKLGITKPHWTILKKIRPNQYNWFVLQNENDKTVVGRIGGRDQGAIMESNITSLLGTLDGKPLMLGPNLWFDEYWNQQKNARIDVITDKTIYRYDVLTMQLYHEDYKKLLLHKNDPLFVNEAFKPTFCMNMGGEIIIDNDKFCFANGYSNSQSVYYPVRVEGKDSMDYKAVCAYAPSYTRQYAIVFDDKHKRFLYYPHDAQDAANASVSDKAIRNGSRKYFPYSNTNRFLLRPIVFEGAPFNPQSIGSDKQMISMHASGRNVLALAKASNTLYVYGFDLFNQYAGSGNVYSGYYSYAMPHPIDDCHCATSSKYNNMLFYAYKNKVYRLNLGQKPIQSTLIYEHENKGIEFTKLRFESEMLDNYDTSYDNMGVPVDEKAEKMLQRIGLAVKYSDTNYGLISIELTDKGEVSKVAEYSKDKSGKSFSKIVDIAYTSLPIQ